MNRRHVITTIAGAGAWPQILRAQPRAVPVVGFLGSPSPESWVDRLAAFREGLSEAGFVEGKNVAVEYRWAHNRNDLLSELAGDLVRRKVDVIVVLGNTSSALAAKAATTTIPIVFRVAVNPVELGLVTGLSRPGGNLTGVTTLSVEVAPKRLELLRLLAPDASVFALLVNPTSVANAEIQSRDLPLAARAFGLQVRIFTASTDRDFDAAFAEARQLRPGGLVIGADAFFNSRNELLAALALQNAMPTISPYREFAAAGGLMSYGGSVSDASRQAGIYTGRVLNGEKAGELPVRQATKVELALNLKTAQALGLSIPAALLASADDVID